MLDIFLLRKGYKKFMYKYEMHLHSLGCSRCGVSPATDYILTAKEKGFVGMVFTNHFYRGNSGIDRSIGWEKFVGEYRDDYLRARELGEKHDIDVLFGVEEAFKFNGVYGKEALIYGLEPEAFIKTPEFMHMDIYEISDFVRQNGGFIVCAHPFRVRDYIQRPDDEPDMTIFDGIEVHNAAGNPTEDNVKAEKFARKNNLCVISGSDAHSVEDFGKGGIAFEKRVKTNKELVEALKNGVWKLVAAGDNHSDLYEYCK